MKKFILTHISLQLPPDESQVISAMKKVEELEQVFK